MARKPLNPNDRKRGIALAERIQEFREKRNITQLELANASGVCIDTIRAIEGKKVPQPGIFTLSDIAEALDTELEKLIPSRKQLKKKKLK
ncbi:transcriptional regulator [Bacteriovorax stolpii]|uniref:helix-turn-helix domain-containing protein n=1 Tax=Bacteriovorax stolpii TaxID=960 RepID=UPI001156E2C0|nr:helix-turn-helix transcriptional regulator [Bacteriovorax stolpii]QDK41241.1 transcriptional regulator [Bacteriovorax stolpii]